MISPRRFRITLYGGGYTQETFYRTNLDTAIKYADRKCDDHPGASRRKYTIEDRENQGANGADKICHKGYLSHEDIEAECLTKNTRPVGRPSGSTIPVTELRVSLTIRVKPTVKANIMKLPKGHLRKHLESLYDD